jgi:6-phosphogluconolactonase
MDRREIEILDDADAVARRGADIIAATAREAVADHGSFTLAVSGGHTPWEMFGLLADETMPWDRTTIYQVDERIAPAGDPDRNLEHLLASLPPDARPDVRPMPVEASDLDAAAAEYAASLPEWFDLLHLGMGPDGHTASLVPGDPVLVISDRSCGLTGPYQGHRRMTLTYPAIHRARKVLVLVTGADKVDALSRFRAGDRSIPIGRIEVEDCVVVADAAAAPAG